MAGVTRLIPGESPVRVSNVHRPVVAELCHRPAGRTCSRADRDPPQITWSLRGSVYALRPKDRGQVPIASALADVEVPDGD